MRFANATLQIFMCILDSFNHYIIQYGVPLDDRHDYTKTDWLMWVAAMGSEEQVRDTVEPLYNGHRWGPKFCPL